MQLNLYDKLIKYITRGAFRQGNAAGGGCEANEETLCNLTYGDRGGRAHRLRHDRAAARRAGVLQHARLARRAEPRQRARDGTAGDGEPQDAALGHESFSRNADADGYEIVIDTRGTLLWDELDASERVSRDYIAYLDGLHISWIACGKERVDLARACEILASAFGVERMAVVGGGHIHTAFLAEVKHWHGAKADSWFSHIAVEVPGEDCRSEWCEPVSDEEYSKLV